MAAELLLREPVDPDRLNGCGLLVVNPPWQLMEGAEPMLAPLAAILGEGEAGAGIRMTRLTTE